MEVADTVRKAAACNLHRIGRCVTAVNTATTAVPRRHHVPGCDSAGCDRDEAFVVIAVGLGVRKRRTQAGAPHHLARLVAQDGAGPGIDVHASVERLGVGTMGCEAKLGDRLDVVVAAEEAGMVLGLSKRDEREAGAIVNAAARWG